MPDFASVFQQANRPSTPLENPMDAYGRAMQLQNMGTQGQLLQGQVQQQNMQNQNMQQDQQSQQVIQKLMASGKYDPSDPASMNQLGHDSVMNGASPKAAMAISQHALEQAHKKAQIQELYSKSNDSEQKQLQGITDMVGNAASSVASIQDPNQKWQAWQKLLNNDLPLKLQPAPTDTPKIQQLKASVIQQMQQESQGLMQMKSPADLDTLLQQHITDAKTHADWMDETKTKAKQDWEASLPQDPLARLKADLNNGLVTQAEYNERKKKIDQPPVSIFNQVQPTPISQAQAQQQFAPDPTRPWRSNARFQSLTTKDSGMASDVDSALNNDYKFGGSRGIQYDRQVQHAAQEIDPNWRQGNYEAKQKMLVDPQVVAANAAILHLHDFMSDYKQLSPQTSSVLLNTPINKWTSLVQGNSPDAAILARLQTTAMSVAGEYGKALGASDAVLSEHERQALFDPSRTGGQLSGVTGAVGTLLQRTVNAKENITRRSSPNSQPLTLLDPDTIEAAKDLGINYTPGGKPRRGAAPDQSPAQPKSLNDLFANYK